MNPHYEFERPIAALEKKIQDLKELSQHEQLDFSNEISVLEKKLSNLIHEVYAKLTPWQRVLISRHPNRPYTADYISLMFSNFMELHGDRKFQDDSAIIGGMAYFEDRPVMVIGHQKGRGTKEKVQRNFGMAKPEGYRKAIRLMELAARFSVPIITFVDTPGAYPGIDAEERGQSEAIADSIMRMFGLAVPVITLIIGEGGSGGALAMAVADLVYMQEFSTYSVISPESCASILWSDSAQSELAARVLKMSAPEVKSLGVIDGIVPEPQGGAHRNYQEAASALAKIIRQGLQELEKQDGKKLVEKRIARYRAIGLDTIQAISMQDSNKKQAD